MQDLNASIKKYIQQAKLALSEKDYKTGCSCLAHAAKCSLELAKSSVGAEQKKHLETYKTIKAMLDQADAKLQESRAASTSESIPDKKQTDSGRNTDFGAPSDNRCYDAPTPPARDREPKSYVQGKNDALSPLWLSDYIGQPQAVTAVKELITAARLKNSALPHVIMYGSHGLGKTTFAKIIANEMHANFVELNVSKITPQEMIAVFKNVKPKDIIFIDEIHTLPLAVAESVLYSAMQDGRIVYTEGKGKFAQTMTLDLPPFTLVGATTEIGKLAKPFTQRAILVHLVEYSDEVIAGIITKSFYKVGMSISNDDALIIAKRARNNPRMANSFVKRIADKALVRYAMQNNITAAASFNGVEDIRKLNITVEKSVIEKFFEENNIDEWGLENNDRDLLRIIVERFNGGPVGLETLSKIMNEATNVISEKYEAYLIKKGFVKIEKDGRYALANAYKALGLPVPPEKEDQPSPAGREVKKTGGNFDPKSVVAAKVPDPIKCAKIEELIVYPLSAQAVSEGLDELFPDITKEYDAETKHQCELDIDFGNRVRHLVCDSYLESRFACVMAQSGYLADMKAQTVEFTYVSQALSNRRYFPDFVIKDYKGRVAIIEMKNFEMMSYHLNIDKYEMLRDFCESKGYGYSEIMKEYNANSYISVDQVYNMPVNEGLKSFILQRIEENGRATGEGVCTLKDIEEYFGGADKVEKIQVFTILLRDRKLKNTDRTGTDFRICLD